MNKLVKRIATTLTASVFALTLCTFAVNANESGWLSPKVPRFGAWSGESVQIKKTDNGRAGFYVKDNPYSWGIYGQITYGGANCLVNDLPLYKGQWNYGDYVGTMKVKNRYYRSKIRCKVGDPGSNVVKYKFGP